MLLGPTWDLYFFFFFYIQKDPKTIQRGCSLIALEYAAHLGGEDIP